MKTFEELYQEKKMDPEQLLGLIQDRDYIFCAQAAPEPDAILRHMGHLKTTGVKDVVFNTCLPIHKYDWFHDEELRGVMQHNAWFFNGDLRKAQKNKMVSDIPQHSTTALKKALFRAKHDGRRPVLMATVAPMDEDGYLSLSISSVYEIELVREGALVLLEVNPNYPRTFGDTMIHISEVDALVESDRPVPEVPYSAYDETDAIIGKHIASLVEDGSTIQLGIGNIPNAVANELKTRKHLGIHSEMFTENMVDLIESGAVDNSRKGFNDGYSVCSFTMGSKRLYQFLNNNPTVLFKPATYTNDPYTIGRNNKFVSINATLAIDLTGQCASESVGHMQFSGSGGQAETVQGSQMSPGGKSIIALHSTYWAKDAEGNPVLRSKIVPMHEPGTVITTSRNDVDYVVTEYGIAWLRGLNVSQRVEALIGIAHPDFRDWLREEAEKYMIW